MPTESPQPDWNDLLTRCKAGDETARQGLFSALMVRLKPIVQSRLRGWSSMDHDDIIQNTLLVVAEKFQDIAENPHYFALNVLRNKIGDALRLKAAHRAVTAGNEITDGESSSIFDRTPADNPDPADVMDREGLKQKILELIPKMPKFCQIFFLAALEGRTVAEVWEYAQKEEPSLKRAAFDKRIFDCRRRLKTEVIGYIRP